MCLGCFHNVSIGVFRVFRHSSPFVAQALPLPLCVIMGDELAAEIEYSKNKCDPSIGVSDLEVGL